MKKLSEQEKISLAKDVTDVAKGLIQMGEATLDNVIDKIKEAIKKRLPELEDKEVDALANNIEDDVIFKATIDKYKEKGLTYEQAKARLDKINADYTEQELKDAWGEPNNVIEIINLVNTTTNETLRIEEKTINRITKKDLNKKERITIATLVLWTFIHSFIIIMSLQMNYHKNRLYGGLINTYYWKENTLDKFFPFTFNGSESGDWNVKYYDFTEFLIYVVLIWILLYLYKFIKKGN